MKNWFITGISGGLGKAMANAVIANGDQLTGTFRTQQEADAFNAKGIPNANAIAMNLAVPESIEQAAEKFRQQKNTLDVLVNNAGIGFTGAIEETGMQEARQVFAVNFFGTLQLTQQLLPLFRAQRSGHIIQVSSHGGFKAFAGFGIYSASKFALEGFSEALAQEIAPLGIRLTIIQPGPFRTGFAGNNLQEAAMRIADYEQTAGSFRERLRNVHGKQEGDPEKAAAAIVQLAAMDNPPLRLPLGKIALQTIASKLAGVQSDLDQTRAIAEKVVF